MTTWCVGGRAAPPEVEGLWQCVCCVLWFGEEEGHSLAHRGTDYYLVREESCAEQDVPHIVLCYAVSPL